MREAGLVVGGRWRRCARPSRPGITTAELDALAEDAIRAEGASRPSSATRHFTGTICASVNDEVVHGIPAEARAARGRHHLDRLRRDRRGLARRLGHHGRRSARSRPERPALIESPSSRCGPGSPPRSSAAGSPTSATPSRARSAPTRRGSAEYGIVEHYGGHGIGTEMHQEPHVLNYGRPGRGPKLVPGPGAGGRADGHPRRPRHPGAGRRLDRRHRRRLAARPTGSTPSRSPRTGPWVLTAEDGGAARLAELGVKAGAPATTAAERRGAGRTATMDEPAPDCALPTPTAKASPARCRPRRRGPADDRGVRRARRRRLRGQDPGRARPLYRDLPAPYDSAAAKPAGGVAGPAAGLTGRAHAAGASAPGSRCWGVYLRSTWSASSSGPASRSAGDGGQDLVVPLGRGPVGSGCWSWPGDRPADRR